MANVPEPEPPAKPKGQSRRGSPTPSADVESLFGPGRSEYSFRSRESKEERLSRLRQEEADKALARQKDLIAFVAVVVLIGVVAAASLVVVFAPGFSDDLKKWATVTLTTILSAGVGYLGGKAQK